MICPNKNSQEWRDLVSKVGERQAYVLWNMGVNPEQPMVFEKSSYAYTDNPLYTTISQRVAADPDYFLNAYSTYLRPLLNGRTDPSSISTALYQRLDGKKGVVEGDSYRTAEGVFLLFPESKREYKSVREIPKTMLGLLNTLQDKFGIGFEVIDDPNDKRKGAYINDGDSKLVLINLAHATEDTPFHEYLHPFVRLLLSQNSALFNSFATQARKEINSKLDDEEVVTEWLGRMALKDTKNSYLQAFFQWISRIISSIAGKKIPQISELTSLKDVLNYLHGKVDVSDERTLTYAEQNLDEFAATLKNSGKLLFKKTRDESGTDYIAELKKITNALGLSTSDQSDFYQDKSGKDVAKRLTPFVGDRQLGEFSVKYKDKPYSYAEYAVREEFQQQGINTKGVPTEQILGNIKDGDGTDWSFAQRLAAYEAEFGRQRVYGKMVHSYMQYLLESDKTAREEAKQNAVMYAKQLEPELKDIDNFDKLRVYRENIQTIVNALGLYVDVDGDKRIPAGKQDRISPELTVMSNLLVDGFGNKIASTIDGLVQHNNGELSMFDWKTGNIVSDMGASQILQHGKAWGLPDSKLSRAYLELAFRTMIIKEHFPDARFRDISIARLHADGQVTKMKLDLQPYLSTIGEYYRSVHPELYKTIKEKGLFEERNYSGTPTALLKLYDALKDLAPQDQLDYLHAQLTILRYGKTPEAIQKDPYLRSVERTYTDAILEISKTEGQSLNEKVEDIPNVTGGFKNFSDIANPKVQVFHKVLLDARHEMNSDMHKIATEHDHLVQELLKDYGHSAPLRKALDTTAVASFLYGVAFMHPA